MLSPQTQYFHHQLFTTSLHATPHPNSDFAHVLEKDIYGGGTPATDNGADINVNIMPSSSVFYCVKPLHITQLLHQLGKCFAYRNTLLPQQSSFGLDTRPFGQHLASARAAQAMQPSQQSTQQSPSVRLATTLLQNIVQLEAFKDVRIDPVQINSSAQSTPALATYCTCQMCSLCLLQKYIDKTADIQTASYFIVYFAGLSLLFYNTITKTFRLNGFALQQRDIDSKQQQQPQLSLQQQQSTKQSRQIAASTTKSITSTTNSMQQAVLDNNHDSKGGQVQFQASSSSPLSTVHQQQSLQPQAHNSPRDLFILEPAPWLLTCLHFLQFQLVRLCSHYKEALLQHFYTDILRPIVIDYDLQRHNVLYFIAKSFYRPKLLSQLPYCTQCWETLSVPDNTQHQNTGNDANILQNMLHYGSNNSSNHNDSPHLSALFNMDQTKQLLLTNTTISTPNEAKPLPMSNGLCKKCHSTWPLCVLCYQPVNTPVRSMPTTAMSSEALKRFSQQFGGSSAAIATTTQPLQDHHPDALSFVWCVQCKHGGHLEHMAEWFSLSNRCPVRECTCKCVIRSNASSG